MFHLFIVDPLFHRRFIIIGETGRHFDQVEVAVHPDNHAAGKMGFQFLPGDTRRFLMQILLGVALFFGHFLCIGIGTGHNLPYYDPEKVERVIGLDPGEEMLQFARRKSGALPFPVEYLALEGEAIPLGARTIDTVLVTYTLCTIPDVSRALEGMHRVLKPSGRLIFCEHGKAPDAAVRKWQDRINPFWKRLAGGCNINRDVPHALEQAGFKIEQLDTMYLPGTPKIAAFQSWGAAKAD